MSELLGWYGYCNSNDDQSVERFNNLTSARMSTPNFGAILSQTTNHSPKTTMTTTTSTTSAVASSTAATNNQKRTNSLSLDDIDNTTDSLTTMDELTKVSPQISKELIITTTTPYLDESPPASHSGLKLFYIGIFSCKDQNTPKNKW